MLPAHHRDNLHHLAKSIFSTFLGLLMALGLESWHQERQHRHLAAVALDAVLRETERDYKSLVSLATSNKEAPKQLGELIGLLESYQRAKARHQSWHPAKLGEELHLGHSAGSLRSSAWSMALADQSVQRFGKAQAEDLADFYQQMGRFQAFLDQPVDYSPFMALGSIDGLADLKKRLDQFSPESLDRILWDLRQLIVRLDLTRSWGETLAHMWEAKKGFQSSEYPN